MIIEFSDLGKNYGTDWIFRSVSGRFEQGVHAITGKNGSGKSTMLQVLAGFVSPNEGFVSFSDPTGQRIDRDDWFRHFSICSPMMELFEELQVIELIELHRQMKPLSRSTGEILEEVRLTPHAQKPIHQLSSGMKQRLKLVLAIFAKTPVIFFDEPCTNLDAEWSDWYVERTKGLAGTSTVVVASNSQPAEMEPVSGSILDLNVS